MAMASSQVNPAAPTSVRGAGLHQNLGCAGAACRLRRRQRSCAPVVGSVHVCARSEQHTPALGRLIDSVL
jgi:hypothetical protein